MTVLHPRAVAPGAGRGARAAAWCAYALGLFVFGMIVVTEVLFHVQGEPAVSQRRRSHGEHGLAFPLVLLCPTEPVNIAFADVSCAVQTVLDIAFGSPGVACAARPVAIRGELAPGGPSLVSQCLLANFPHGETADVDVARATSTTAVMTVTASLTAAPPGLTRKTFLLSPHVPDDFDPDVGLQLSDAGEMRELVIGSFAASNAMLILDRVDRYPLGGARTTTWSITSTRGEDLAVDAVAVGMQFNSLETTEIRERSSLSIPGLIATIAAAWLYVGMVMAVFFARRDPPLEPRWGSARDAGSVDDTAAPADVEQQQQQR